MTFSSHVDDSLNRDGPFYVDLKDHVGHLEHKMQPLIALICHHLGVSISTSTCDLRLWLRYLDYFSIMVNNCT